MSYLRSKPAFGITSEGRLSRVSARSLHDVGLGNIVGSVATESDLTIEFIDSETIIGKEDTMRFGRMADLVIDEDNQHLHRELGEFKFTNGQWWIRNIGRSIPLRLWTSDGNSRSVVMSGSEVPLTSSTTTLEFEAGRFRYELSAHLTTERETTASGSKSDTIAATDLPLTLTQKQLIVSLAEPALRNPGEAISVPASKEAAARLGWPMTKFNAKLQNVCEKYSKLGVRGLGSTVTGATMDRRLRLVEYCVFNKVVSAADLSVLDQ